jgi:hypothetical protein
MRNKIILGFGAFLMVLGLTGLIVRRVSYATERDLVTVGSKQATFEMRRVVEIPPLLSGLVVASGALLLFIGWQKKA